MPKSASTSAMRFINARVKDKYESIFVSDFGFEEERLIEFKKAILTPYKHIQGHIFYFHLDDKGTPNEPQRSRFVRYSSLRSTVDRLISLYHFWGKDFREEDQVSFVFCLKEGLCQPPPNLLKKSRDKPYHIKDTNDELHLKFNELYSNYSTHVKGVPLNNQHQNRHLTQRKTEDKPTYFKLTEKRQHYIYRTIFSNFMTRFFCGMQEMCFVTSANGLLAEAKRVVADEMDVVSTLPTLTEGLRLLNFMAPKVLQRPPKELEYYQSSVTHENSGTTIYAHETVPDGLKELLAEYNFLDMELYDFVAEGFKAKMDICNTVFEL